MKTPALNVDALNAATHRYIASHKGLVDNIFQDSPFTAMFRRILLDACAHCNRPAGRYPESMFKANAEGNEPENRCPYCEAAYIGWKLMNRRQTESV